MEILTQFEKHAILQFIEEVLPFSESDFNLLLKSIHKKTYKKGDLILGNDTVESRTKLILKGAVHQYTLVDGNVYTINISLAGMPFNSFRSYVEEKKSTQFQIAITDVVLIYVEKTDMERLLLELPSFCYIYTKKYEQVHYERENRAFILQHSSAEKKFELFMSIIPKASRLLNEVSQKLTANFLGMTPETYSRVKKKYFANL